MICSPYTIPIPTTDVVSFVFSSGTPESRQAAQYFNADCPSKCYSLAHAEGYVKQFAHGLQKKFGLRPGDRVLLYSKNQLFFPVLLWGVLAAGCIFTAASPGASVGELEYQIKDSGAKILITGADIAPTAVEAAAKAGLQHSSICLFCDPGDEAHLDRELGLAPWTSIWTTPAEAASWSWRKINTAQDAQETTAIINYSSGTTGLPKGVEISHYNLVANSVQLLFKRSLVYADEKGQSRKKRLDISGERWLAPLPMYHAYGQTYYCINASRLGAKVFIMPSFNTEQYLHYLDIYRITFMTSVPAIMTTLIKQPNPRRFNLGAIESVVSGSAPLSPEIGIRVAELYLRPGVNAKQGWGMTETTCSITGFAPDDEGNPASIGWLNPNCAAKIVPVEGHEFETSTEQRKAGVVVGEIWVAGPNIMRRYYNRPEETAATFVNEDGLLWLKTGDIGYIDDRGYIFIVDRLKILSGTYQGQRPTSFPAELEQHLLTHPDVVDAAVVGVKRNGGEYPRAFVVRKNGIIQPEELSNMIRKNFAPHKWITGGIIFVDSIPRTGSGKVIRRRLLATDTQDRAKI